MSQQPIPGEPDPSGVTAPPHRRGFVKTAWLVIALFVSFSVWSNGRPEQETRAEAVNELQQRLLTVQGQYMVAAAQARVVPAAKLYESAQSLNSGPLEQRLRFLVLAGELAGPAEAIQQIDALRAQLAGRRVPVPPSPARILAVLRRLYADYSAAHWEAPSLSANERELLQRELGWYGALALAPKRTGAQDGPVEPGSAAPGGDSSSPHRPAVLAAAWRTFAVVIVLALGVLGLGLAGLAGGLAFLVLILSGKLHSRMTDHGPYGGVYLETFALWMLMLLSLSLAAALLSGSAGRQISYSAAASLLSLAALGWPLVRGVPWPQARADLGLTAGQGPFKELGWGAVCYVSNLPVVAVGFTLTLALFRLQSALTGAGGGFEPVQSPAHPIIEWVREAGWSGRFSILVLAAVIAPIVEEIVFRGLLYRHLRDATARWRSAVSIMFCAGVSSLIFAIIHPQGYLAAPALTSVALGLTLAREWRGSLLAPMAMHGINNGLMLLMLFALL